MTDPLAKHWEQPPVSEIWLTATYAAMTNETFAKLGEYSSSIPSGKYEGKMWKSQRAGKWYLRWYVNDPNDTKSLFIPCRPIVILGAKSSEVSRA